MAIKPTSIFAGSDWFRSGRQVQYHVLTGVVSSIIQTGACG
jgi:hypothetical protein